jgi:hypothetical protein
VHKTPDPNTCTPRSQCNGEWRGESCRQRLEGAGGQETGEEGLARTSHRYKIPYTLHWVYGTPYTLHITTHCYTLDNTTPCTITHPRQYYTLDKTTPQKILHPNNTTHSTLNHTTPYNTLHPSTPYTLHHSTPYRTPCGW